MELTQNITMRIIDNYDAVRLMINVYLIKKVKSVNKPVNLEKFVENVCKEFKSRDYNYSRRSILYTWKHLLDNYQFYKEKFTDKEARKVWTYFDLMDTCFDDFKKQSSTKFKDSKWTFFLIDSLNKYKPVILRYGLTMEVLQAVEDDFRKANNDSVNQKDIYNQWVFLKRFYRQNEKTGYYRQLTKNHAYFTALKSFFQQEFDDYSDDSEVKTIEEELVSAIESITEDVINTKRRKTDSKTMSTADLEKLPKESVAVDDTPSNSSVPFTIIMQDILLQHFKRHKTKLQSLNGNLDEDILRKAYEEFCSLGYAVTQQSISNEWNDLSYRYELIKNSENPESWPYYNDMTYIYNNKDTDEASVFDDQDNQSTIGSIIMEDLRKNQNIKHGDYIELSERLLNVYESNSKEFLEIKEILVERNLLREETNYLLSLFVEKFNTDIT